MQMNTAIQNKKKVGNFFEENIKYSQNAFFLRGNYKHTLRKHAYLNILKILPPKTESFQTKILIFFHISAQNIDCGYLLELRQF